MLSNKKIKYFFLTVFVLFATVFTLSFSEKTIPEPETSYGIDDDIPKDQVFYWFYATVKIDQRTNGYKIMGTSGNLQKGYIADFEKDLWQSLSQRKIVVGPFSDKSEAANAKRLYVSKKDRALSKIPKDTVPSTVYWFAINFDQSDRLGIFVINRVPGAVQHGSENFFIEAFFEQLPYQQFAIGPFYDQFFIEEYKRIYRKNE